MPQIPGSKSESLSQLRCLPHVVQCLGHEVTLKEELKTRDESLCLENPEERHLRRSWISEGSVTGSHEVTSGSGVVGATGGVTQGHGVQDIGVGHQ